jgi:hypothetical protein
MQYTRTTGRTGAAPLDLGLGAGSSMANRRHTRLCGRASQQQQQGQPVSCRSQPHA